MLLTPIIKKHKNKHTKTLKNLTNQNYIHTHINNKIYNLSNPPKLKLQKKHTIKIIINHFKIHNNLTQHLTKSFKTTLKLSNNTTIITNINNPKTKKLLFSTNFTYPIYNYNIHKLKPQLFSFNNPTKTYPTYNNLNIQQYFNPNQIIQNPKLSLTNNTIHN